MARAKQSNRAEKKRGESAAGKERNAGGRRWRVSRRAVSAGLIVLALGYGFLAGFRTIQDADMGFHLATARYVMQHHTIPSTDVLSYRTWGAEWLYPPFAGVLLYDIYSILGYGGLIWFCSLLLMAMIACLMRGPSKPGSGLRAALAILAVPLLALHAIPRADIFSQLFFTVFLVVLWRFHESGARPEEEPAEAPPCREDLRLWLMPILMVLWVNFHPGYVAGLGLVLAFVLVELLDMIVPQRREGALRHIRQAWPALAATFPATLLNPYGIRLFKAPLILGGLHGNGLPSETVREWQSVPVSLTALSQALDWRNFISSFWWLAMIAVVAIAVALWRRQLGAALLLGAALYAAVQHNRLEAMFAVVVAVVGSSSLMDAWTEVRSKSANADAGIEKLGRGLGLIAACALGVATCVRMADLATSRFYQTSECMSRFGTGESWWYPERAMSFIQKGQVPGNLFTTFELSGFAAWRLGPAYPDFVDGRQVTSEARHELDELIATSVDSPLWHAEADRWKINALLFSLARVQGLESLNLASLCQSSEWRVVYMDDVSLLLLRNRPENQPWIQRYGLDCRTHVFRPPEHASHNELGNFYANSGVILLNLGRTDEAATALESAEELLPYDPTVHVFLGWAYSAQGRTDDVEREYKAGLSLLPYEESYLMGLGQFYVQHRRFAEARPLIEKAAEVTENPIMEYGLLGTIDLSTGELHQSLMDYERAEATGKEYWRGKENVGRGFFAQTAAGRASAYSQLGETQRAIDAQKEAIRWTPEDAGAWKALGDLYASTGQQELKEQAYERARELQAAQK